LNNSAVLNPQAATPKMAKQHKLFLRVIFDGFGEDCWWVDVRFAVSAAPRGQS
jgi:hypothetical protein